MPGNRPAFRGAELHEMEERVDPRPRDIGISLEVTLGREFWPGVAALKPSDPHIMLERVDAGRRHIRIGLPIPGRIEEQGRADMIEPGLPGSFGTFDSSDAPPCFTSQAQQSMRDTKSVGQFYPAALGRSETIHTLVRNGTHSVCSFRTATSPL